MADLKVPLSMYHISPQDNTYDLESLPLEYKRAAEISIEQARAWKPSKSLDTGGEVYPFYRYDINNWIEKQNNPPADEVWEGMPATDNSDPKISFRRGASLVSCELGKSGVKQGKKHEWTRGVITSFSKQSRRRILRLVSSLKRSVVPEFVTLTYPDLFPGDPRTWKRDLDVFFKRLLRQFPQAIVIWKMEPKVRKTGENKGQTAPHFHLLVYGVNYLLLHPWVPVAWNEIAGGKDPYHLAWHRGECGNGNEHCVQAVHSVQGVLYYTSKYICKADNVDIEGIGRSWGIVGRKEVIEGEDGKKSKHDKLKDIQGEFEVVSLDFKTAMTVIRMMRRRSSEIYKKGRFIGRRKIPKWGKKFTLICDSEFWYSALPRIQSINHEEV